MVFDSTATVNGPADFTVNTGSLSFQTVPAAELESIAVPTANDLAVSAAISGLISVKRLVIGGVPQPAGSVAVNGGTVTVSGTSMSVWQGANGGAWSLPANWTGDVPDGATAEVDFGYSTLAVEASISLDADVTLKVLTYRAADGASLRLTGANALTLVAKGAITVPAGNTLILDVPLTLGGEVLKKGGGKLVVNGGISTPGGSDIYWLTTQKGEVVVNSPVSLCRLRSEDPERLTMPAVTLGADALVSNSVAINAGWVNGCGEIVQNGGEVSLNPPTLGFANGGYWALSHSANCYGRYTLNDGKFILPATGEGRPAHSSATADFIQNGGLFSVTRFAMYATEPSTYTLNGGTLEIGEYWSGDAAHSGAVSLNGGTVLSKADEAIFRQAIDIELGGDVTFTQVTEQVSATLSSPIAGAGTIRQAGPGTLTLAGCHYFTGAVTVDGGTLGIETPTIVTNLAATAGSLRFGSAGLLSEEATLDLGANGTLTLDGEGETTVRKLFLNGIERRAGRYSATDNNPGNRLSGDGVLIVLEGNELGTIIQIR